MFDRIEPDRVLWDGDEGGMARADAIIWATGFRPDLRHLAPLKLRERAGAMPTGIGFSPVLPPPASASGAEADALSALANLGYRRAEAMPVVARVVARLGDDAAAGTVIREALRELAPH